MKNLAIGLFLLICSLAFAQTTCPPAPLPGIENEQTDGFPEYLQIPQQRALVVDTAVLRLNSDYYNVAIARRDWSRFTAKALAATNEHAFYDAMRAWVAELAQIDSQSEFISPRQIQAQSKEWARTGTTWNRGPTQKAYVIGLDAGGPAEQAGIRIRDRILAIDGEACWNPQMFRGEAASQVTLTVQSGREDPRDLTLTRAVIPYAPLPPIAFRLRSDPKVAYVWVRGSIASGEEINNLMQAFEKVAGPDLAGMILDLRGQSLNDLTSVETLLSPFLPGATYQLVYAPNARFHSTHFVSATKINWANLPLVVVVDYATSDLGVWAAGMLQRRPKTLLVGNPTQAINQLLTGPTLSDGSRLVYPNSALRFSDGSSLFNGKVIPSIFMRENWLEYSQDDDPYIKAALTALAKMP